MVLAHIIAAVIVLPVLFALKAASDENSVILTLGSE